MCFCTPNGRVEERIGLSHPSSSHGQLSIPCRLSSSTCWINMSRAASSSRSIMQSLPWALSSLSVPPLLILFISNSEETDARVQAIPDFIDRVDRAYLGLCLLPLCGWIPLSHRCTIRREYPIQVPAHAQRRRAAAPGIGRLGGRDKCG